MECPDCGAVFQRGYELKRHQLQHQERGFSCAECGARFARKDALKRHDRTKPISCNRSLARKAGWGTGVAPHPEPTKSDRPRRTAKATAAVARNPTRRSSSITSEEEELSSAGASFSSTSDNASPVNILRAAPAASVGPEEGVVDTAITFSLSGYSNHGSAMGLPRLPPAPVLSALLDAYTVHGWVMQAVLHLPTLRRRLFKLIETAQTPADYAVCGLCPETVQAVFWSAYGTLEMQDEAKAWGAACRAGLDAWAARLGLEADPESVEASDDELFAFVRAGAIALGPHFTSGLSEQGCRLRRLCNTAHRLSRFGSKPGDKCVALPSRTTDSVFGSSVDVNGAVASLQWITSRNPMDLAGWLDAEERVRASSLFVVWDTAAADFQGIPRSLHSGGYETSGGFVPGFYFDTPIPCPERIFEALPPTPATEEEVLAWFASDPVARTAHVPISYGAAASWPELPIGSPERLAMTRLLFGGYLEQGPGRNAAVSTGSIQTRLVAYRDFCKARGWKLNEPPPGDSEDEIRAREMHDVLVVGIRDFFDSLPPEVKEADLAGDGRRLRDLGAFHWGPRFGVALCQNLINWHGMAITLYSPTDFAASLANPPTTAKDLEWIETPAFLVVKSHALTSAKIAHGVALGQSPDGSDAGRLNSMTLNDEDELEDDRTWTKAHGLPELPKPVAPFWPMMFLRAAWCHVLILLGLKVVAEAGVWEPKPKSYEVLELLHWTPEDVFQPDFEEKVVQDVDECLEALSKDNVYGGEATGSIYSELVGNVIKRLLHGLDVSREDAEAVRLLRSVGAGQTAAA